jgi:hypothetical protein
MSLRPLEYAFWPDEQRATYRLVFCEDDDGNHITLRGDPELVRMMRDANREVVSESFDVGGVWERPEGWPDEWRDGTFD